MALVLVNTMAVSPIPSSFARFFARFRPLVHHSSFIIHHSLCLIVAHRLAQFQEKFLGHAARILLCRTGLA
jgi:hypothetical protein